MTHKIITQVHYRFFTLHIIVEFTCGSYRALLWNSGHSGLTLIRVVLWVNTGKRRKTKTPVSGLNLFYSFFGKNRLCNKWFGEDMHGAYLSWEGSPSKYLATQDLLYFRIYFKSQLLCLSKQRQKM